MKNSTKMKNNTSSAAATADKKRKNPADALLLKATAPSNKKLKSNFDTSVLNKQLDSLNISGRSSKHALCESTHKINGGRYLGYEGVHADEAKKGSDGALKLVLVKNARGWNMMFPIHVSIALSLVEKLTEAGTPENEDDGKNDLGLGGKKHDKQNASGNDKSDKIEVKDQITVGTGKEDLTVAKGKAKTMDSPIVKEEVKAQDSPIVKEETKVRDSPVVNNKEEAKGVLVAKDNNEAKGMVVVKDKKEAKGMPVANDKKEAKAAPVAKYRKEVKGMHVLKTKNDGIDGSKPLIEGKPGVEGAYKMLGEGKDDALLIHEQGKWQCPRCLHNVSNVNGFCPNKIEGRVCNAAPLATTGGSAGLGNCTIIPQQLAVVSRSFLSASQRSPPFASDSLFLFVSRVL